MRVRTSFGLSEFFRFQATGVFLAFGLLFIFVILRLILKGEWIAVGVTTLVVAYLWYPEVSALYPYLGFSITLLRMAGLVLVLRRFGVLAVVVAIFFDALLNTFPITVPRSNRGSMVTLTRVSLMLEMTDSGLASHAAAVLV